ncbi:4,4'-diaponeurosporenoate glycosyltransferase [Sporosarcina sp. NCCP-2716]|uniref:glycosyltransferase n=1 Tax=Sporosarcina sp. NCCP-2716 TaxID=2943679 RepID=UPI00203D2283|nr:glycosyltransferase family 2 protein [Sporosarcina sp. NCCP-2716]GKV68825.1 4,4'-diaponeurosporenoate glycosyltransferase [Sporosarcina sp. NCCP-2716]
MAVIDIVNWILTVIALGAGFLMFWRLPVPQTRAASGAVLPKVTLIVPARNEEQRIRPLLESLQQQTHRSFDLLVIDDDSTDRTAEVVSGFGAKVIRNQADHSGAGKSAACWRGAQAAEGDWLLFLDADTLFERETGLEDLLLQYKDFGASGILSVQPFHTVYRPYENLSAVFNIIVVAGMNLFTIWKDRFRTAGSFGPCILCSREDYFRIGGHEAIDGAIMDDLALGEAFLEGGLPVRCIGGKGTISFRMYPEGFKSMVDGWCKSFALGSQSTHPAVMALVIAWIAGAFISGAGLVSSLIAGEPVQIAVSAVLYAAYALQTGLFARRVGSFHWFFILFYPVLYIFFAAVFLYSLFRVRVLKTVEWRGRKIDVK